MRAITLWQPWASLWINGVKIDETRHWSTDYRGALAVHAAQRPIDRHLDDALVAICRRVFGPFWREHCPRSALIGTLNLVDCLRTETLVTDAASVAVYDNYVCGNFERGRFAWRGADRRQFAQPIPYKGKQGWFSVPDELVRAAA